jgi:hypothetical protein
LPLAVSEAFLRQSSADVREVFPVRKRRQLPACLATLTVIIVDGKAVKRVQKRLAALRGVAGGLVGGKALVAQEWSTGLAVAMQADADGDANEVRLVAALVPQVRAVLAGPRLWMADRAFCDLDQPARFTAEAGDHFLLRYHPKVHYHPDTSRPPRTGADEQGRRYVEDWGWLGREQDQRRRYVRRIRLTLSAKPKDDLILVTDLVDATRYPAQDLLTMYAARWGIEHMFQDVTEVFGLQRLIGGTPQAALFQLAFCLLLYNLIEVLRGYVAQGQRQAVDQLSEEKLFEDVQQQLIAWQVMIDLPSTLAYFHEVPTVIELRARLKRLLSETWAERWRKAPAQRPHGKTPRRHRRTHHSTYRILQAYSHGRLKARRNATKQAAVT